MTSQKRLRENLKESRFKKRMTQEQLAKEAGVKRAVIAQWENYGHNKFIELKRVCEALGVSSTELLGF